MMGMLSFGPAVICSGGFEVGTRMTLESLSRESLYVYTGVFRLLPDS